MFGQGHRMVSMGINYERKNKYSFEFALSRSFLPSKERSNNNKGLSFNFGPLSSYYGTYDESDSYNLLIGRIIKPPRQQIFRLNLMAGLAFTEITNRINHRLVERHFLFSSRTYFEYDEHRFNTLSLIFKPKIELIIGKYLGLNLFNQITINKDRIIAGVFGFELSYGIISEKNDG